MFVGANQGFLGDVFANARVASYGGRQGDHRTIFGPVKGLKRDDLRAVGHGHHFTEHTPDQAGRFNQFMSSVALLLEVAWQNFGTAAGHKRQEFLVDRRVEWWLLVGVE